MTGKEEFREAYYIWLCGKVYNTPKSYNSSYNKLLNRLFERPFLWSVPIDQDRASDGYNLRRLFNDSMESEGPCTILEMMVGLSVRKEIDTMGNYAIGDRTGQWFWGMIASLGLGQMTDQNYDEGFVDYILDRFLTRRYAPNGEGGLFTIEDSSVDMRDLSIWKQSNMYLNEVLTDEGVLERRYANG